MAQKRHQERASRGGRRGFVWRRREKSRRGRTGGHGRLDQAAPRSEAQGYSGLPGLGALNHCAPVARQAVAGARNSLRGQGGLHNSPIPCSLICLSAGKRRLSIVAEIEQKWVRLCRHDV